MSVEFEALQSDMITNSEINTADLSLENKGGSNSLSERNVQILEGGKPFVDSQLTETCTLGAQFLRQPKNISPTVIEGKILIETTEIEKVNIVVQNIIKSQHPIQYLLDKCSSWTILLHVVAWCLRVIKILQSSTVGNKTVLLRSELIAAEIIVVKYVQKQEFADDVHRLKDDKSLRPNRY
ncbi:hypothetical protein HNY73_006449 [Argiope bruennichi]|uniref:Uncharacterized protein n=1 Tax=Argiope bruennichi TaxID=94029 RepID=A0A8T0FN21_ARGBR|nr:hypothetical protein HNY73_006449 [Argiope bruennichi]